MIKHKKKVVLINNFLILILIISCSKQKIIPQKNQVEIQEKWVDSIYNGMSLKEKVGQLFMVDAYSNRGKDHKETISKLISDYHLGGLCFFQGGPVRQAKLTNHYQSMTKIPLMIAIDAEWGLKMRLDSTYRYPYNMTLGAVTDNTLIYRVGNQIGKHCKRMGIHVNFAPVIDVNTNPKNPVIGVRSYGEDKYNVAKKAIAFTQGMQSEGVLACAKHFPGHGDTSTDSHKALPIISFDIKRIDSVELYPYKQLFNKGVAGVMVAHLNVPSLDSIEGLPSSLSHKIVSSKLKEELGFKGVIFTDALNMKGASNYKVPGEVDLAAFKAGNDMLVFSENAPKAIDLIIETYNKNEISEERLAHSVKKILSAKYDAKLHQYKPIEITNLVTDLNTNDDEILYNEVIRNAITIVKNSDLLLSTVRDSIKKIAYIKLGSGSNQAFLSTLEKYRKIEDLSGMPIQTLSKRLKKYDAVIIGYHRFNTRKVNQLSIDDISFIQEIAKTNKVILNVFASQYCLINLMLDDIEITIVSYENSKAIQNISAQFILETNDVKGKLPASINKEFAVKFGIEINK